MSRIFLLLIPLPPRSTLFPYTTLFRSSEALEAGCMVNMTAPERGDQNGSIEELFHPRILFDNCAAAVFAFAVDKIGDGGDRKSTRLNSSHSVISYAVFCLKKKNKRCNK